MRSRILLLLLIWIYYFFGSTFLLDLTWRWTTFRIHHFTLLSTNLMHSLNMSLQIPLSLELLIANMTRICLFIWFLFFPTSNSMNIQHMCF